MVMRLIIGLVLALLLVEIIKVFYFSMKTRSFYVIKAILLPGGMPSLHSALVSSLFVGVLYLQGISVIAVVAFLFGAIVIYDSMTLRREVSLQKAVINKLHLKVEKSEFKTALEEGHIGHSPVEVLVGVLVGILSQVIVYVVGIPW